MDIASLIKVGILSNVQPPRRQAKSHLGWAAALLPVSDADWPATIDAIDFFEPGLGAACQLLATAKPASVAAGRKQAFQSTPGQVAELAKLDRNRDVAEMLAASDFWAATQVTGDSWTQAAGVPEASVSLAFTSKGRPHLWSHVLPSTSFTDYQTAAQLVPGKVDARDKKHDDRIWGCTAYPQYYLAFALDLHAATKPVTYTMMLLDIVPGIVAVAVQRLKSRLMVPRPNDQVFGTTLYTPVVSMPAFSAVPGGHAAVSYALARVLSVVTGAPPTDLEDLARNVSEDREAAGLHTSIDTLRGRELGRAMGEWLVEAVNHPDAFGAWSAVFINATNEW